MSIDSALNGLLKLAIAGAVSAAGAFGVLAVLDRLALDSQAAERRALLQRNAELDVSALAPGSALPCLDGGAGEAVETACEKQVFANPQSTAAAVAYMGARLALLTDAHALAQAGDASIAGAFAATRRAIELDRFGIAAHVLAVRDGCTAMQCAAFAALRDSAVLKANLKAQAFDTYVTRYAGAWNKTEPEKQAPVATAPSAATVASAPEPSAPSGQPVASKYKFPSAASIPPVSIMNAEPPLPKAAAVPSPAPDADAVPVPQRRPPAQAPPPPAR